MKKEQELTPDRIQAIRKGLGLTQKEAGKLLGGGPHAFTKYEAGILKPNAAMVNLLLMLDEYPQALCVLGRDDNHPVSSWMPSPFEVEADDIASLSSLEFTDLVRRLLFAEARVNDLPRSDIHVASNINAPDGGEDGRISWQGGPEHTQFLPSRLCQFQLKAGEISPSNAGKDVLTSKGGVKQMVRSVLELCGHYIMLCTHPYNRKLIDGRQRKICNALTNAGFPVSNDRIIFRGGDQIAIWVNTYPPVALWVREKVGLGALGGFSTWKNWKDRSERPEPWVEDSRLSKLSGRIQSTVTKPQAVLRVVGLSGIGKSRLCLEALKRSGEDEISGRTLRDFVMYAVQSEVSVEVIHLIVEKLASSGGRAIVVVDDCDAKTHQILVGMVLRNGSRLSLITLDNEIPEHINADTIKINEAPATVTESIVNHVAARLQDIDRNRLAYLSRGFPKIAIRIAEEIVKESDTEQGLIDPVDGGFINKFICGRSSTKKDLLLQSAQLLAAFGPIRVESLEEGHRGVRMKPAAEKHLAKIAEFGRQLTREDLYTGVQRLTQRDIVKRRGGLRTLEPRPIAVRLAERQWRDWDPTKWDRVLSGDIGPDLSVSAARRLAELNTTKIAKRVVVYVCRENGPLDQINGIGTPGRAEVLSALAEINPKVVAEQIGRSLDRLDDLRRLGEGVRQHLVHALETIAFHSETFKIGARLLLRLEIAKPPSLFPDSSRPFGKLFSPMLGATEADGNTRLMFIGEVIDEVINEADRISDQAQMKYVIDALVKGCTTGRYSRMVGPEIQGSRKTLNPWCPTSRQEWSEYIAGCVDRLGNLAILNDEVGEKARSGLGGSISRLISHEFLEVVEKVIHQVIDAGHSWTMALRQLKGLLANHSGRIGDESCSRVRSLIEKLEPTNLRERIRIHVTEPRMPEIRNERRPVEARYEHRRTIVQELASEFLQNSSTLTEILPEVSRGRQIMANEFGVSLAERAQSPFTLLESIVKAIEGVPAFDRNYALLSGFIAGLPAGFHDEIEEFKTRAIASPKLAPVVPMICRQVGLTSADIERAIDALNEGTLSPWDLHHWTHTWVFDKIPPAKVALLLDAMLNYDARSFELAVTILGEILDDEGDENNKKKRSGQYALKLADFRPQLLKMIQNAGCWSSDKFNFPPHIERSRIYLNTEYYFENIVARMLAKGRKDSGARKTALELARTLVRGDHDDLFDTRVTRLKSILDKMLTDFPEIVWPIIGGAIVRNPRFANRMWYVLRQPYNLDRNIRAPILGVPEDILFAWGHANPGSAPTFLAGCVQFLSTEGNDTDSESIHPIMSRLLDEFGERDDVQKAIESNIHPHHWSGSLAGYYVRLKKALQRFENHTNPRVRQWAEKMSRKVERRFKHETIRDEEREAQVSWIG